MGLCNKIFFCGHFIKLAQCEVTHLYNNIRHFCVIFFYEKTQKYNLIKVKMEKIMCFFSSDIQLQIGMICPMKSVNYYFFLKFIYKELWNGEFVFWRPWRLVLISLIVSKLCSFRHRSNFGQYFHHKYLLKRKFLILMVSSEVSGSGLSQLTLF